MNDPQLTDIYSRQDVADKFIRWLRHGLPEVGWSGEPRLTLAFNNGIEQRWELLIHEPQRNLPNRHVLLFAAPAGFELNEQGVALLCRRLVEIDVQRAGNSAIEQFDRMVAENERRDREHTEHAAGATADALGKFYHEAGKTLGVTKTFFPQS